MVTMIRNPFGYLLAISALITGCYDNSDIGHRTPASAPLELVSEDAVDDTCFESSRCAKHVILVIGDGMQLAHEIASSRYLYGTDDGMAWRAFPKQGYVSTWDVTAYDKFAALRGAASFDETSVEPSVGYDPDLAGTKPYPLEDPPSALTYYRGNTIGTTWWPATDSASAATAIATGRKTDDGNIAWLPGDPDDGGLPTIAERLRAELGFAIGVVSTQPFSHATPASFLAHNVNRNHFYTGRLVGTTTPSTQGIADEIILSTKPDVVISGGYPVAIDPGFLTAQNPAKGYISKAAYDNLTNDPSVLFVQRQSGVDGGTTIETAANTAIASDRRLFGLFGGSTGAFEFAIPNDSPSDPHVTRGTPENPSLSQAAVSALKVLRQNPEGFFLMVEQGDLDTANHANNFKNMVGSMADLEQAVRAILAFVDEPDDDIHWNNTVLLVMADHATGYLRLNPNLPLGLGDLPTQQGTTYPDGEVAWSTGGHSNELVTYSAKGPHLQHALRYLESPYPGTDILDNTQMYEALMRSVGLE
jgi:alkaline phosphatase